jgi:hypothetical protein
VKNHSPAVLFKLVTLITKVFVKKNRPALRGDRERRYEEKLKRNKSETVIDHFKEEGKILLKMKP